MFMTAMTEQAYRVSAEHGKLVGRKAELVLFLTQSGPKKTNIPPESIDNGPLEAPLFSTYAIQNT